MGEGSNTSGRIAELRKRIQANKGKYARAYDTANELRWKMQKCATQIRLDQDEIEAMGGKVRR